MYCYTVIFKPTEEGGSVVHVPAFHRAATQGETREGAREMAKDLIIGYLEALAKDGRPAPVEDLEPLTEPVREVLELVTVDELENDIPVFPPGFTPSYDSPTPSMQSLGMILAP